MTVEVVRETRVVHGHRRAFLRAGEGPALLLDVEDFWQPLLTQLRRMVDDGYLDGRRLDALGVVSGAEELVSFVERYEHPARKWTAPPAA